MFTGERCFASALMGAPPVANCLPVTNKYPLTKQSLCTFAAVPNRVTGCVCMCGSRLTPMLMVVKPWPRWMLWMYLPGDEIKLN